MHALVRTCSAFQSEAERLLYRRVYLTRGLAQLHAFKLAISTAQRRRAKAVVFLHIAIPPRYGDRLAKDIFRRLPNLVELQVDGMAEPHAVFARAGFRLRNLVISGDSFRYIHGVEDCMRNPEHLTSEYNAPFQLDLFSNLSTLTLVQPAVYDHGRLMRYCSYYGITHLNIVFQSTTWIASYVFGSLADQLVSFRITIRYGVPPVNYVDWLDCPPWWPTDLIRRWTCPRLRYLELCQNEDYTYSPNAEYYDLESEVADMRKSCPAIRTLVWRPGMHHQMFSEVAWYREEVRRYTELLFNQWPTLERFERLRLDSEDEEALTYVAYIRTDDDSVSVVPAAYNAEAWRKA
ncbi:hypothetical protein L226DRAFT_572052 [Lentinus tigrinus ALCF2SS1-7]|uniref:uncharacterized protein n=1 Tax=Lentinus tigrinus ALCF2SS1-7 TaxID=1328758 RepID=UPI001165F45B|nr:hypothetical protein L226DRAFT_572052 [Lentinus tigrinus ALCF2SS1-7]